MLPRTGPPARGCPALRSAAASRCVVWQCVLSARPANTYGSEKVRPGFPRSYGVDAQPAGAEARKTPEASQSSGRGAVVVTLLAFAVGGMGAYAGGVYYALDNREFREIFVSRVYGADRAVAQAQRWRDEKAFEKLKTDGVVLRERAARFGSDSYQTAASAASTLSTKTQALYETSKNLSSDIGTKTKELVEKTRSASDNIVNVTHTAYQKSSEAANNARAKSREWYDKGYALFGSLTGKPQASKPAQTTVTDRSKALDQRIEEVEPGSLAESELSAADEKIKGIVKTTKEAAGKGVAVPQDKARSAVDSAEELVTKAGGNVKTAAVAAKHEANAAKDEAAEAAHAAKDAATRAAHATNVAATGAAHAATDAATKAAHAAKVAAVGAAHAASKFAEKAVGTPEVAALLLASRQSDPVIGHLGQTLHELDGILGQLPGEQAQKEAQQFMVAAARDVKDLNAHLAQLRNDHHAAMQKIVAEHSKQLQQAAKEADDRTREEVQKREDHLREDFALEKAEVTLAHSEELKRRLNSQAAKFEAKLRDELSTQALTLERRWLRQVRLHVDRERGGRLARLDQLETRLVALERLTDHNAAVLEESVRGHRLRAAVQALRDALSEPIRRPFARELAAVQAVAGVEAGGSSQGNALICAAAASIPPSAANVGVDTLPDLVSRFTVVADEVRKVALVPEDAAGVVPHAISTILSSLMFRKHGLPDGDDVESILARTEFYLREEELDAATRELTQLKGWAKLIASDWLKAARAHLEVKQALELIELESNALNLRMG